MAKYCVVINVTVEESQVDRVRCQFSEAVDPAQINSLHIERERD